MNMLKQHQAFDELIKNKILSCSQNVLENINSPNEIYSNFLDSLKLDSNGKGNFSIYDVICYCMYMRNNEAFIKSPVDNKLIFSSSIEQFSSFTKYLIDLLHNKLKWICFKYESELKATLNVTEQREIIENSKYKTLGNIFELFVMNFIQSYPKSLLGIKNLKSYNDSIDH